MISPLDLSRDFPFTIFLSGMMMAIFAASGLFFFKFWRKTQEKFFLYFAYACWALSFERVLILIFTSDLEGHTWVYFCRLAAFMLIFAAVIHANRNRTQ